MILEAPADAPIYLRYAAKALLVSHIGGGAVGMIAGTVALLAPKGELLHRFAGNVFFVAMLIMAGVGAGVAPFLPAEQLPNTTAGVFTFYMVLTGWLTVKRPEGTVKRLDGAIMIIPLGGAVIGAYITTLSQYTGIQHMAGYVIATIATLCVAGDLHLLLRRGLVGRARISRHVWRMCTGLLIAVMSFFTGQQKYLPEIVRGTFWLNVPGLIVITLMVFWLLRVWITRAFRAQPLAA